MDGATSDRRVRGARLDPFSSVSFGEDARGRPYVISQQGPVHRLRS